MIVVRFARLARSLAAPGLSLLLGAGPFCVPVAAGPALPHGVFSLGQAGAPVPAEVLANPNVTGVSLRQKWGDVEPSEGAYDWTYLDREIQRAAAAGKVVLLRVTLGGFNTPDWVMQAGVQTFSFVDDSNILLGHQPEVGGQMLWFVTGDPT